MLLRRLAAVLCVILLPTVLLIARTNDPPVKYKDPHLSIDVRVDDLVARMTLEEKVSQLMNAAPGIPRLDIPAYDWWNESLHGVARAGYATVFPQAIGLAATWDTDLMHRVADVISTEARAKYYDALRKNDHGRYKGLTMWSPNINIFRDPRWGRGQETYGEDPYLTARMAVQFVRGLQGDDPKYFKVVSTLKHYAVHSGPEPERHRFDARTDSRDLYETYLPAFEAGIKEAHAYSVMCAYNRYMGEPCCGSDLLLTKILRGDWKFPGYVVSDCGAIVDIHAFHKVAPDAAAASALALKTGTDLECGQDYKSLVDAVKRGLIKESDIDVSLKRLFTARFKLGMFDPPEMVPFSKISIDQNDSAEHHRLSLQAARESIVLLKNDNQLLPLRKTLKNIAVVGPTADDLSVLLGNYNGAPSSYVTPLKGLRQKLANQTVAYEQGCNLAEDGPVWRVVPVRAFSTAGRPGLQAEYFANRKFEGKPLQIRQDSVVDSNWVKGGAVPGLSESDFSIRWSGELKPAVSGRYQLAITVTGGYRLSIGGSVLIDNWANPGTDRRIAAADFEAGHSYPIKLEYFQAAGRPNINFQWQEPGDDGTKAAVDLARKSDVVIFAGGIAPTVEGEEMKVSVDGFLGGDRTSIDLPKVQERLLEAVSAAGKPVVLVLTGGGALGVNWAAEHVGAIVQIWYPGQEGGTALADVLLGDYNPAGRLPVTFYKSVDQLPRFEDYNMAGRTYRYFTGEPLFAFGYGLSYTRFQYSGLQVSKTVKAGQDIKIQVRLSNAGQVTGDEVVQVYLKHISGSGPNPIRSLAGFKRISLKPGRAETVSFTLTPRELSVFDGRSGRIVEPGQFEVTVGGGQPGPRGVTAQVPSARFTVIGDPYPVK
ncbi:MAG TPA: glycoside hydrolase family 3 C-terminal domain-containing protein [Blastocatellia bacterium]|nr:glycoside hydrolase family 3 C-terminal domain-containing protein [Blastocatellia bacterium]